MALRVSRPRCSHTEDYARNIEQTGSRHFESSKLMLGALFVCDATYSPASLFLFFPLRDLLVSRSRPSDPAGLVPHTPQVECSAVSRRVE